MQRTAFLKLAAATTVAAGTRLAFPWAADAATTAVLYRGMLWRGNAAGKVQTSVDGGRTWKPHTDLGSDNSITKLAVHQRRLRLTATYSGHPFSLVLARDKRSWRTV